RDGTAVPDSTGVVPPPGGSECPTPTVSTLGATRPTHASCRATNAGRTVAERLTTIVRPQGE
ncbi:MAG: hypothetical protein ABEI52_09000, partial [Halobacteriaceae archaeon]